MDLGKERGENLGLGLGLGFRFRGEKRMTAREVVEAAMEPAKSALFEKMKVGFL